MSGFVDKKIVNVKTKSSVYDVVIGEGLIDCLDVFAKDAISNVGGGKIDSIFVVSDSNVWDLYGRRAVVALSRLSENVNNFVFKAGEKSKNPDTLFKCVQKMAEAGCSRDSLVVTLGGGVACDLGGFAAATFMRGLRLLAVPTSLLAMVDASVGGKTAVDLPSGKNLFGAFHQPIAVIIDLNVLEMLSALEFKDSVGEVVKHAILGDVAMFEFLLNNKLDKSFIGTDELKDIIFRNVEIKRDIVCADEKEAGIRQTLNLGHTIGHAIEKAKDYTLGHGTCVACGLCVLSRRLANAGIIKKDVSEKIISAYEKQDLPTTTDIPKAQILELVKGDKKRHGNSINIVVPKQIGNCEILNFSFSEFEDLLGGL